MVRSGQICELCSSIENLTVYTVEPGNSTNPDQNILVCSTCEEQIVSPEKTQSNHWRCLNESMCSEVPAVQVVAWRMLSRLKSEGWPQDLLDMLYLDDDNLAWAKATGEGRDQEDVVKHIDSNGIVLENGDTVVLIKDLEVKGANFTAKRGTSVRNIRLVHDNPEQIEGKINGQGIVILTQYVKK
jgi:protein PhnA